MELESNEGILLWVTTCQFTMVPFLGLGTLKEELYGGQADKSLAGDVESGECEGQARENVQAAGAGGE